MREMNYRKDLALPFDVAQANLMLKEYGSPLYVYDAAKIVNQSKTLNQAFNWAKDYKNYFAVKATPTPYILKLLHEQGMGFDCSTRTELEMLRRMGISGTDIFYSSNNTPIEDFELAIELGATVNIDDFSQIPTFIEALDGRNYEKVALRYNPGDLKSGNAIIGEPTEAKYGMSLEALLQGFSLLKDQSIKIFGLHTMVASNELNPGYFADTTNLLLDALDVIEKSCGINLSFINLGGGFGLNYQVDQQEFDAAQAGKEIKDIIDKRNKKSLQIFTENGRYVTGASGFLITKVRYIMDKYKTYLGVDASMHNLMRPGMYDAYHHLTVLGKSNESHEMTYDVVGSLCENNDKFAIDRPLPKVVPGDILVIHDAGAHGHAMGFNYNGLLKSAEVLLLANGQTELIRKAETVDYHLQNIVWPS